MRVFEVDHPATQEWKRRVAGGSVAAKRPGASRGPAAGVTYVPVDFTRDSLAEGLSRAGFDAARPAFVSWLGVTMYLDARAIEATVSVLGEYAPGTEIVLDYMLPAGLRDAAGQAYATWSGRSPPSEASRGGRFSRPRP